ncbi:MAG: hypothetical protein H9W81_08305 [Enterococcus sp.]|nr:hypothetical protein [Enterococcus sp.]
MAQQKKKNASKGHSKKAPNTRSGNPEIASKAREIEQKKKAKNYREPKPVGASFRKFSQVIIVVAILAGLLLSGLGSLASFRNDSPDPVDMSNTLTDVNGTPLNGVPVETGNGEPSEVEGLVTDTAQTSPVEVLTEEPAK